MGGKDTVGVIGARRIVTLKLLLLGTEQDG